MNWNDRKNEGGPKTTRRAEYECLQCHRKVFAYPGGYMPIHRKKGQRPRCDGSEASVRFHKKL